VGNAIQIRKDEGKKTEKDLGSVFRMTVLLQMSCYLNEMTPEICLSFPFYLLYIHVIDVFFLFEWHCPLWALLTTHRTTQVKTLAKM
jgi:hypothetical protein